MKQEKVEELQQYLAEIRENLKLYVKEHLSPDVLDLLRKFVDRCDTILNQQDEVNTRYDLKIFQGGDHTKVGDAALDPTAYLLVVIKKKLALLEEARMECVLNGTLEEAEHDFCTLEKAYLDLKVDIESFIRLQELKERKNL
ncbi:MAG TPA: hypothetical protein O0X27_03015 [Methanocorpusculum sp.]|nr:hypothetical protein [Methanocorpusculum sp.]